MVFTGRVIACCSTVDLYSSIVKTRFVVISVLLRQAKATDVPERMLRPVLLNRHESFASVPPVNVATAVMISPSEEMVRVPLGGLLVVHRDESTMSSLKPMDLVIVGNPI